VRSVDYRENENKSLLHIEAGELPLETRNQILAEVFGMIEDEGSLPSRIAEAEARRTEDELAAMAEEAEKTEESGGDTNGVEKDFSGIV
jgi:hypothetical protein